MPTKPGGIPAVAPHRQAATAATAQAANAAIATMTGQPVKSSLSTTGARRARSPVNSEFAICALAAETTRRNS
jgi:hypothetical protein